MKSIFFLGGMQGRGWLKLMVAAFELADKPVKNPKTADEGGGRKTEHPKENANQKKTPWKASSHCPHCNTPINVAMEYEGIRTYATALQAVKGNAIRVGQRKPECVSNRDGPSRQNRTDNGSMDRNQNNRLKCRLGKKGDRAIFSLGRFQNDKKNWAGRKETVYMERKGGMENEG